MGTSSAGGGGGGSGGSGGGGGGSGGSGGNATQGKSGQDSKGSSKEEDAVVRVLSRLKPNYLALQFAGVMTAGVVHDLVILNVDINMNKSWTSMCGRMGLKPDSSFADVRDAILRRYQHAEPDARIRETVTATVLQYFEELCGYNDELLYGPGKDDTFRAVDMNVVRDPLTFFLRCHYVNVLQREEPKLPTPELRQTIVDVSSKLAMNLSQKLAGRYGSSNQATAGKYLQRASADEKEKTWLLKTIRE